MSPSSIFEWFNQTGNLAQWIVAFILLISAILIIWQIREQTKTRKGENFIKVIEILNDDQMKQSIESIYSYSKYESLEQDATGHKNFLGSEELKKVDLQLPKDIRESVIRVRENYHLIGTMMRTGMIDKIPFLILHSMQVRDMWSLLSENIKKIREQRSAGITKDPYFYGFEWLTELCIFWRSVSSFERGLYSTIFSSFVPVPLSPIFRIRMYDIDRKKSKNIPSMPEKALSAQPEQKPTK